MKPIFIVLLSSLLAASVANAKVKVFVLAGQSNMQGAGQVEIKENSRNGGHGYPVGTLILSGGPSGATIGNILQAEPFNGVIDELAIYPFALRAGEISLHANRARDGLPYFKAKANRPAYAQWIPVKSYPMGWKLSFNRLSGKLLDSTFVP